MGSQVNVSTLTVSVEAQMAKFDAAIKSMEKTTNDAFGSIQKSAGALNTAFVGLAGALAIGGGLSKAKELADEYNSLSSRVKDATAATRDYTQVSQQLFAISQKNGVALKDSVSVFQSLSRSSKELGASNADMIKLTDIVQKLGVIGGSSAEQMKNGLLQFSQATAGGVVHAEEFNSILENMPSVAAQMAKGMGVSMGELRTMVKDQKLSSKEMFDALMKGADDVNERFNKMPPTIERAWQSMSNQLLVTVGKLDEASGASKNTANAIMGLAKWIGDATTAFSKWNDIQGPGDLHLSKMRLGFDAIGGAIHNAILAMGAYGKALAQTFDSGKDHVFPLFDLRKNKPDENNLSKIWGDANDKYMKERTTLQALANKQLQEQIALKKQVVEVDKTGHAAKGPDEKTIEKQRKHVADMLHDRQVETRELELQATHQDKARAKLEDQIKYIKDSVLSEKEKTTAISKVTALYERELQLHKLIKAEKDQAKQREKSQDFLADLKKQEQALDNQIAGHKELNKHLSNQVRLQELLKEGNKGSKDVAADYVAAQEALARIESKQNTADALEQTKKLDELTKGYGKSLGGLLEKEQQQADALERKAAGLENLSGAIQARTELEKSTNETLQKQYEILEKVNELIAKDPNNTALRAERQKVEESINKTYMDQAAAMAMLGEAEERQLNANRRMKDQKNVLDAIGKSTAGYADKIRMLDMAYADGRVNQEQYEETLKDLYHDGFKKAKEEADKFAKTLTHGLEKAFTSGKDFKTILKDIGKELALLAAKKLLFEPFERGISNMAMGFFGPKNGVPQGYGSGYGPQYPGYGPYGGGGYPAGGAMAGSGFGGMGGLLSMADMFGIRKFNAGGYIEPYTYGVVGDGGAELAYGGQYGLSIFPNSMMQRMQFGAGRFNRPRGYQGFGGGRMGIDDPELGMISQQTHHEILGDLLQQKYESGIREGVQNVHHLNEIKYQADRSKGIAMQGGYTGQQFSRSQFEIQMAEYNEAAQQWGGGRGNADELLARAGFQNTGERWRGFSATPLFDGDVIGGDGGFGLPAGIREASYSTSQGNPLISTGAGGRITEWKPNGMGGLSGRYANGAGSAFSNSYNNGDLRSAHDYGSYRTALLRSGMGDHMALANVGGVPYFRPDDLDALKMQRAGANNGERIRFGNQDGMDPWYKPRRGDLGGWSQEGVLRGMDRTWEYDKRYINPNTRFGTGEQYGPPRPDDLPDPTYKGATKEEIRKGQEYMRRLARGKAQSASLDFGLSPDMVMGLRSGSGPATVEDMAAGARYRQKHSELFRAAEAAGIPPSLMQDMIMGSGRGGNESFWGMMNRQTPWNWMQSAYGYGKRRMRRGGDVSAGEMVITGDGGLEAFVPKDNGKIISNDQLAAAAGNFGGGRIRVVLNNNAPALAEPEVEQVGDMLAVTLNAVRRDAVTGGLRKINQQQQSKINKR